MAPGEAALDGRLSRPPNALPTLPADVGKPTRTTLFGVVNTARLSTSAAAQSGGYIRPLSIAVHRKPLLDTSMLVPTAPKGHLTLSDVRRLAGTPMKSSTGPSTAQSVLSRAVVPPASGHSRTRGRYPTAPDDLFRG